MGASRQTSFKAIGFWAPRPLVNVLLQPRLWNNIRRGPVKIRFEESEWSRFPTVVRFSYAPPQEHGSLCLTFTNRVSYTDHAHRWRAVADAVWRVIKKHSGVSFQDIPVDIGDCIDSTIPATTFRFSKRPNDPHDLIPNAYSLDRRRQLPAALPWEKKRDAVYFRGSLTGSTQTRDNPRVAACLLSRKIPGGDCKLTNFSQTPATFRQELELDGVACHPAPIEMVNHHRYVLDIDGNSSSWDRFWEIGMFRSVPIRFETEWQECWHDHISDGEHFVSATRTNLEVVLDGLRSCPRKAEAIADAAAKIARGPLSRQGTQHLFETAWLRRVRR